MNLLERVKELFARPIVLWAVALSARIIAGKYEIGLIYVFLAISVITGITVSVRCWDKAIRDRRVLILFVFILSFFLGIIQVHDRIYKEEKNYVPESVLKNTEICGTVTDISQSQEKYLFVIENPKINLKKEYDDGDTLESDASMLLYSDYLNDICIGDKIMAKGSLYPFSEATNYGQFDQREYYYAKDINMKLYADSIEGIDKADDLIYKIRNTLFEISVNFQNGLNVIFNSGEKGILSAMLTGNRSELDESTKDIYKRIGIAHVLSISGLHISLLGLGLFNLLLKITKRLKISIFLSLTIIFLYGTLTGFSVSTERAVIMLFCMLVGRLLGMAYDGQSAAGFAAIIILVFNPTELFESGFQLSFFAVFGIFAGNEISTNLKIKNPILKYIFPGIYAQLATFPIILRSYYSFSPYSFIANPILLPFMSVIVMSGLLAGIFGTVYCFSGTAIFYMLGSIMGGPAHFCLELYDKVAEILLSMPFSDIICGCPTITGCIIYYVIFFIPVIISGYIYEKKCKLDNFVDVPKVKYIYDNKLERYIFDSHYAAIRNFVTTVSVILYFCIIGLTVLYRPDNDVFYTSFIDVGQGLSVYVEAEGISLLADGGSSNVKNIGKYRIEPFLLWKGCSKLNYILISHTDSDHINGISELIENGRIKIEKLVIGTNYDDDEKIIALAKKHGIEIVYVNAGDRFTEENGFTIDILAPDREFIYEDKNQASLVAKIKEDNFCFLFTGDSDIYSESEYCRYFDYGESIDVLQCAHHGSKYATSELLLEKIKPKVTVISCSKNNSYGHPSSETLKRLEEAGSDTYITAESGLITIIYDKKGKFKVSTY
ncbi:MAG: DNA internalization-related competence protein ComEC/Rec2 [Lachnospiraceae bacterium]|nr:DNA internalization-related competence protein ComEC/Rec2 [Lachnospiraceae bacterium]